MGWVIARTQRTVVFGSFPVGCKSIHEFSTEPSRMGPLRSRPLHPPLRRHPYRSGNPAIFQKQGTLKEAQRANIRPVAFRPNLTMGLALYRKRFELPTGKNRLLGAGHIEFEVFSHGVTS